MARNRIEVAATAEEVFEVLLDAYAYERWLVGCKKIRGADPTWPAVGSRFHHRVGVGGPLTVSDSTKVHELDTPRRLVLEARARPAGVARVAFEVEPTGGGSTVTIEEHPVRGIAAVLDNPLQDKLIAARNRRSLRQLKDLVERSRVRS